MQFLTSHRTTQKRSLESEKDLDWLKCREADVSAISSKTNAAARYWSLKNRIREEEREGSRELFVAGKGPVKS